ncbi:hypothetical protein GCM10008098_02070 [Rhodanobacter panaciterrae]|uniref:Zinc ribbon domain-containing protein n=1 Tax=Rhodanobacter panaciterrae TaxID=490572 RepID=A0ABQ2ZGT5_9GAMM|nr:hypothetical protein GCM10008098_02070 [Rhodanobacter panaciterrae]
MKPLRATLDPQVIADWKVRMTSYRRAKRRLQPWILGWLTVVLLVCVLKPVATPFALLATILVSVPLSYMPGLMSDMTCPHCGASPLPPGGRGSLLDIDFCENCFYWLKSPTGSR